jgi:hypothetical protein
MRESANVEGKPSTHAVPKARRVVKGDIVPNWKEPTGEHPRRQRRGG